MRNFVNCLSCKFNSRERFIAKEKLSALLTSLFCAGLVTSREINDKFHQHDSIKKRASAFNDTAIYGQLCTFGIIPGVHDVIK